MSDFVPGSDAEASTEAITSKQQLLQLEAELEELARRRKYNRLEYYEPFAKQREFHEAGAGFRERLFMAGNQLGKTWSAGAEAAMHATGIYPPWWKGRRFDRPTVGWVGGLTGELVRDGPQRILCGRVADGEIGTGMLPLETIIDKAAGRGTPDLLDYVVVQHVSGGKSIIKFKLYAQGRQNWQTDTVDWVWFDEEPPPEIYSEGITRTNSTLGPVWLSFTPLLGMTQVVARFKREQHRDRHVTVMTIHDRPDYSAEQRQTIIGSYAAHERAARSSGVPTLGSGAIFPVSEDLLRVQPFRVPDHWSRIGGLDFGIDHPFAGAELAWDRDADIVYTVNAYKIRDVTPPVHVAALKPWGGGGLRFAWPHDGLKRDFGTGLQLARQYRGLGLGMHVDHATFEDGSYGVEAGLTLMLTRMERGGFKIFANLEDVFDEIRGYHRKDGQVVKENDDILSAIRAAIMMLRFSRPIERRGGLQTQAIDDNHYPQGDFDETRGRDGRRRPSHASDDDTGKAIE